MYLIHSIGTCWPAYSWISPSSAHNRCPNVRETHAIQLWLYKSYIIISLLFHPNISFAKKVSMVHATPANMTRLHFAGAASFLRPRPWHAPALQGSGAAWKAVQHHRWGTMAKGTMESNDSLGEMSLVRWASGMLTTRFQACITRTPAASHCSMLPR